MKITKYLLKCVEAGVISLVLLCGFAAVYDNSPIAAVQPNSTTDYRFVPESGWSFMTEGFGYGKTDGLGYNNAYFDNLKKPDVVFIGSSHTEALQVPQNANFVYLLNRKFGEDQDPDNDLKCLNLGISGHSFEICASNFEYVIEEFPDAKYVVIETSNVAFSESQLDSLLVGEFYTPMEERSFLYKAAQRVPYARLLVKKIRDLRAVRPAASDSGAESDKQEDLGLYREKMGAVLKKLSVAASEKRIGLIILLHEEIGISENGEAITIKDQEYKTVFKDCCAQYGIEVVDVTVDFMEHYEKNSELPYGFSNSTPGSGHLNKVGHQVIADAFYDKLCGMEEAK